MVELNNIYNVDIKFDKNINFIYCEEECDILEKICLLKKINHGEIIIDDFLYSNSVPKSIRKKIGYVSKYSEEMFFNDSVSKELEISLKLLDIEKEKFNALELVGLSNDYLNRDPFTLSSGEKRKLAIACSLVSNPSIIVLDNPFVGLDYISKTTIEKLLIKLKKEYNKTIIILSNNIEDVYRLADYVYFIKNNSIILEGPRSIIFKNKDILKNNGILLPMLVDFSDYVLEHKNIKLGYRYDINDLLKDIYRNAR